jgi:hypothetical protein
MPRTNADVEAKDEIVTFRVPAARVPAALKSALFEIAEHEGKSLGALLREQMSDRVRQQRRRVFEAEARHQSLEAAAAEADPNSDAAQVQREIDALFDEFADEWK